MRLADCVYRAVRGDGWRDVYARALRSTRSRRRLCIGLWRPGRLAAKSHLALIRRRGSAGCERSKRRFGCRPVGRDFDEPRVDNIGIPGIGQVELDRVVVDIARAVRAQRTGHEDAWINRGSKGIDSGHDGTASSRKLKDRPAESRIVDIVSDKNSVIDRLPEWTVARHQTRIWDRFPITLEVPFLDQLSVLPVKALLIPRLRLPMLQGGKCSRLELHENVVGVRQWRLVVYQQIAILIGSRRRGVRVVDLVREERIEALGVDVDEPCVLRVLAPLRPGQAAAD